MNNLLAYYKFYSYKSFYRKILGEKISEKITIKGKVKTVYKKSSKGELAIKAILDKHNITVEPQYRLPDEKYLFKYDFYLTELNIFYFL